MSNFPKLIPAFIAQLVLDPAIPVGDVARGAPLNIVTIQPNLGFLRSEPSYPIKVDAVPLHGADYVRRDPSGKHVRLEVNSVFKDKSGATITYKYTGITHLTPEVVAVFTGADAVKTTEYGDAFTHVLFETGNEELRILEHKIYVASGRFIVESGKPLVVEYSISEVA